MRRAVWVSLLLIPGIVGLAHAQSGTREKPQAPTDPLIVNACVQQVRQAVTGSRFEAYLNPRGQLRSTGTDHEREMFNRCLREPPSPTGPDAIDVTAAGRTHGPHKEKAPSDRPTSARRP